MIANFGARRLSTANSTEMIAACEAKMRMDVISANMTHATNLFMECVTASAIMTLQDGETDGSAASAVAKFVALAFAFGTALFF
jgi:hypothetical protein